MEGLKKMNEKHSKLGIKKKTDSSTYIAIQQITLYYSSILIRTRYKSNLLFTNSLWTESKVFG